MSDPIPFNYRPQRSLTLQNLHPAVQFLFEEMAFQRRHGTEVMTRAGMGQSAATDWKRGVDPHISNLEAALNVLGYRISVERME